MKDDGAGEIELRAWFRERAARFAREEIAPRTGLHTLELPPDELWRGFGPAGLTGVDLPAQYGGEGGDLRALAGVVGTLASVGGNLGLATSYMARQLSARLHILGYGTEEQRSRWLPGVAAGQLTPCLAVSEPGAGAHPKHLSTRAERDGDDYVITGEKAWVTNGPLADVILLLAITGVEGERKQFSVFLVPSDTPGVEATEGVKIDFLHPSPHCGFRLDGVRVPAASMLGPEGDAFEAISLPMRKVEDVIATAAKAGALRHQLRRLAAELRGIELDRDDLAELGRLAAAPDGVSALAMRGAELLDRGDPAQDQTIEAIAAAARDWLRDLQEVVRTFIERTGISPSAALAAGTRDIVKSTGIAGAAHAIRAERRARRLIETVTDLP